MVALLDMCGRGSRESEDEGSINKEREGKFFWI